MLHHTVMELPEISTVVIALLSPIDILTCLLVCRSWHNSFEQELWRRTILFPSLPQPQPPPQQLPPEPNGLPYKRSVITIPINIDHLVQHLPQCRYCLPLWACSAGASTSTTSHTHSLGTHLSYRQHHASSYVYDYRPHGLEILRPVSLDPSLLKKKGRLIQVLDGLDPIETQLMTAVGIHCSNLRHLGIILNNRQSTKEVPETPSSSLWPLWLSWSSNKARNKPKGPWSVKEDSEELELLFKCLARVGEFTALVDHRTENMEGEYDNGVEEEEEEVYDDCGIESHNNNSTNSTNNTSCNNREHRLFASDLQSVCMTLESIESDYRILWSLRHLPNLRKLEIHGPSTWVNNVMNLERDLAPLYLEDLMFLLEKCVHLEELVLSSLGIGLAGTVANDNDNDEDSKYNRATTHFQKLLEDSLPPMSTPPPTPTTTLSEQIQVSSRTTETPDTSSPSIAKPSPPRPNRRRQQQRSALEALTLTLPPFGFEHYHQLFLMVGQNLQSLDLSFLDWNCKKSHATDQLISVIQACPVLQALTLRFQPDRARPIIHHSSEDIRVNPNTPSHVYVAKLESDEQQQQQQQRDRATINNILNRWSDTVGYGPPKSHSCMDLLKLFQEFPKTLQALTLLDIQIEDSNLLGLMDPTAVALPDSVLGLTHLKILYRHGICPIDIFEGILGVFRGLTWFEMGVSGSPRIKDCFSPTNVTHVAERASSGSNGCSNSGNSSGGGGDSASSITGSGTGTETGIFAATATSTLPPPGVQQQVASTFSAALTVSHAAQDRLFLKQRRENEWKCRYTLRHLDICQMELLYLYPEYCEMLMGKIQRDLGALKDLRIDIRCLRVKNATLSPQNSTSVPAVVVA
ncbi:hypothetical protein BG004_004707, partial [Podila humilis]